MNLFAKLGSSIRAHFLRETSLATRSGKTVRLRTRDSQSFTFRMPAGIPGDINRSWASIVETQIQGSVSAPTTYGVGVLIDATTGNVRLPQAGDTTLYGVLARPFPTNSGTSGIGTSTPPTSGPVDVLKQGYMSVVLQNTTAAKKADAVYVCIQSPPAGGQIGGFEAASNGNNVLVGNAYFMGPADTNGNTEIRVLF